MNATTSISHALDAIKTANPSLHAFLQVFPETSRAHAALIDSAHSKPLAGLTLALKDNICLGPDLLAPGDSLGYGGNTTCASRMLEHYKSPFTATAAQLLINSGAVIAGKTNLDEFAMGSSCERSAFGPTLNPHDTSRVPGGSSGGSAAAVASGMVDAALGSDTGGSIRQPASFCGIVGIKPTYGRVSRYGLVAYASSLDQIGPLARDTTTGAKLLQTICAHDPLDSTSSLHAAKFASGDGAPVTDLAASIETPVADLTLGVPREARSSANHPDVSRILEETIATYRSLGAKVIDIDLPRTDYAIAAYYIVACAEASSNLARFDGIRYGHRAKADNLFDVYCRSRSEGFGPEVQRRIMLGTHILSSGYYDAYYNTALKARRVIKNDFDACFAQGVHAILMPVAPSPAFKLGEKTTDPLALYLEDIYTVAINLAGLPAMSIPAGHASIDEKKLPIGMQLICKPFDEVTMLSIARMFERTRAV